VTDSVSRHVERGGFSQAAAELSAHRLHCQLVLLTVDAAYDSVLTLLDVQPPSCESVAEWLVGLSELPCAPMTGWLLRLLATDAFEQAPS
jgi:hypothetical protein